MQHAIITVLKKIMTGNIGITTPLQINPSFGRKNQMNKKELKFAPADESPRALRLHRLGVRRHAENGSCTKSTGVCQKHLAVLFYGPREILRVRFRTLYFLAFSE